MTSKRGPKGLRDKNERPELTPEKLSGLLEELKSRPAYPLPCLQEDAASIEALITVLLENGVIKDGPVQIYGSDGKMVTQDMKATEKILRYVEQYRSALSGLVMLLVDDGIIKEGDLDLAILAFHHAERAYSNRPSNNYLEYREFMVATYRELKSRDVKIDWKTG